MRIALWCALVLVLIAGCAPRSGPRPLAPDTSMIGRRFGATLDGASTVVARLISTPGDVEYAIHHVITRAGERLLITRMVGLDASSKPIYEITAAMRPPRRGKNEVLVVSACKQDGKADPDLIAIARRAERAILIDIRQAWRANGPGASIDRALVAGVTCEHEGWREP